MELASDSIHQCLDFTHRSHGRFVKLVIDDTTAHSFRDEYRSFLVQSRQLKAETDATKASPANRRRGTHQTLKIRFLGSWLPNSSLFQVLRGKLNQEVRKKGKQTSRKALRRAIISCCGRHSRFQVLSAKLTTVRLSSCRREACRDVFCVPAFLIHLFESFSWIRAFLIDL